MRTGVEWNYTRNYIQPLRERGKTVSHGIYLPNPLFSYLLNCRGLRPGALKNKLLRCSSRVEFKHVSSACALIYPTSQNNTNRTKTDRKVQEVNSNTHMSCFGAWGQGHILNSRLTAHKLQVRDDKMFGRSSWSRATLKRDHLYPTFP